MSGRSACPGCRKRAARHRLNPGFVIEDVPHIMATHLATAVPRREFGDRVASLSEHRDEIIASIDFLITGV